jgi:hypothetical protein
MKRKEPVVNTDQPTNGQPQQNAHQPAVAECLRLTGPGQLVAVLPYLLGFLPPVGSLTVVAFRGRRVVLVTRTDLPAPGALDQPDTAQRLWGHQGRHLAEVDAETITIVGHTDSSREDDLHQVADHAPLPVQDLIRTMGHRWWSLDCPAPTTCHQNACRPWGDTVPDDPGLAAVLIAHGAGIPGTRQDLDRILTPGPLADTVAARLPRTSPPSLGDTLSALAAAHAARRDGPITVDPDTAAVLLHALTDVHVRDACLVWDDDAAWWLWTDLIRAAPLGWVAPVATLIALAAYRRGDGVTAATAAQHALLDQPDYNLAHLVQQALAMAITPDRLTDLITEAVTELPDDVRLLLTTRPDPLPDPRPGPRKDA